MGFSAVRYASDKKHLEMLRLLLSNGADCNIISKVEVTVCTYVRTYVRTVCMKYLLYAIFYAVGKDGDAIGVIYDRTM